MKIIGSVFKVILAGVVAVAILSVLLMPYSFTPVHIGNDLGNTDYVWEPGSSWMKMTEGVSFGRFDSNGYNNLKVVDNPDILILGSSHAEATNVMQDKNIGYLIDQKLGGKYSTYNMAISGHHLFKVCQYLPKTLEIFEKPPKVIIIETDSVKVTKTNVDKVKEKKVDFTPSHNTGIVAKMQKIPFLRLAYHRIDGGLLDLFLPKNTSSSGNDNKTVEEVIDFKAHDELFEYLETLKKKYNTEIVIFYHPVGELQADGTIKFKSTKHLEAFSAAAEKHGVTFIDMTERFEKMYYEEHLVPHGFNTGKIASGHMNEHGHRVTAERLLEVIRALESEGRICK